MTGGEIYGNTSGGYGGGVWVGSSTFTMTGGEIYGNTSGGSSSSGGGVYLTISPNNVFKKTGGVIYGNENAVNAEKRNKVLGFEGTALPNYGDAVYVKFSDGSRKRRETSTMENDNLDSTTTTGWIIPEN